MSEHVPQSSSHTAEALPWSYRQSAPIRYVIDIVAALLAAIIGTLAHRMGASSNIPYGLILGWLIVGAAAWSARARDGITGFAVYLIVSTLTLQLIARGLPFTDAMIVGLPSPSLPWLSRYCGVIWLYGTLFLEVAMLVVPSRWFTLPTLVSSTHSSSVSERA